MKDRTYTIRRAEMIFGGGWEVRATEGIHGAALVVTSELPIGEAIKQLDWIIGDHIRCIETAVSDER